MKKILVVVLFICFSLACVWADQPKVAIIDLAPKAGFVKSEAEQVTDIIRSAFVNTNKFTVLERSRVDQILAEQAFAMSDVAENTDSAIKVGKMVAADYIVAGSIGRLLGKISLNVRLINISTGKVVASQSSITTDDALFNEINKMCSTLTHAAPTSGTETVNTDTTPTTSTTTTTATTVTDHNVTPEPEQAFQRNEIGVALGANYNMGYYSGGMHFMVNLKYSLLFVEWFGLIASVGLNFSPTQFTLAGGLMFRFGFFGLYSMVGYSGSASDPIVIKLGIDFKLGTISLYLEGGIGSFGVAVAAGVGLNF